MADLTIICPTYGRARNARRLALAFAETCTADTRLVFACNENDPELSRYYTVLNGIGSVITVEQGRRGMCDALASAYELLEVSLGFAVGFMGDDHLPRTVGWDQAYIDALVELGTGFVYGADGYQNAAMATQVAMTSNIPEALGYMTPPGFIHLCVDVVWTDTGNALGKLTYLPDVLIEHMHPLAGKGKDDSNYAAVNSGAVASNDAAEYRRYNESGDFDRDVAKLKALL